MDCCEKSDTTNSPHTTTALTPPQLSLYQQPSHHHRPHRCAVPAEAAPWRISSVRDRRGTESWCSSESWCSPLLFTRTQLLGCDVSCWLLQPEQCFHGGLGTCSTLLKRELTLSRTAVVQCCWQCCCMLYTQCCWQCCYTLLTARCYMLLTVRCYILLTVRCYILLTVRCSPANMLVAVCSATLFPEGAGTAAGGLWNPSGESWPLGEVCCFNLLISQDPPLPATAATGCCSTCCGH